ncbi:hypothetical protein D3C75_994890 [compost metagenome]
MAAKNKRIKDVDNVPGDPLLREGTRSLRAVSVEQIAEYMNSYPNEAPQGDVAQVMKICKSEDRSYDQCNQGRP